MLRLSKKRANSSLIRFYPKTPVLEWIGCEMFNFLSTRYRRHTYFWNGYRPVEFRPEGTNGGDGWGGKQV